MARAGCRRPGSRDDGGRCCLCPAPATRPHRGCVRCSVRVAGDTHPPRVCCGREAVKSLDVRLRRAMGQGMPPEPRPEVIDLPPAVHGSLNLGELQSLGLRPEEVLDFSANINPYAPSTAVHEALAGVPLGQYPDCECLALRAALAEAL